MTARDTDVLRRLAERKLEFAVHPLNEERRALWYDHDGGTAGRPMVLAEFQGEGVGLPARAPPNAPGTA